MNYRWLECPQCRCHVAVNWTVSPGRVSGSVRRWDSGRSINDGKPFVLEGPAAGAIVSCVCGAAIPLPSRPDAVGGERTDDLRVTLPSGD